MYLTWIAIIASLLMGVGAVLIFVFAVKKDYFRNIEDVKYQVFWSDVEELVESSQEEDFCDGSGEKSPHNRTRIE